MATKPIIQSIYFARLAEQGERFEDMKNHMKDVVLVKPPSFILNLTSLPPYVSLIVAVFAVCM